MNKKINLLIFTFLVGIISVSCEQKVPTFSFKHHFIHNNLPTGWVNGIQTLADYNNGDGDLDLVSKVWTPWKGSANHGKSHADYIENLTIK
jgi:hypothetical protein